MSTDADIPKSCLVCKRPLIDKESVQVGLCPSCREEYLTQDSGGNLQRAWGIIAISNLPQEILNRLFSVSQDAQKMGEILLRWGAAKHSRGLLCGQVLRELGYTHLATEISKLFFREISLKRENSKALQLYCPYNQNFILSLRQFPGVLSRREKETHKFICWVVPEKLKPELLELLRFFFPHEVLTDDRGYHTYLDSNPELTHEDILRAAKQRLIEADHRFLVRRVGDTLVVKTPYNGDFVQQLKAMIPYEDRSWNPRKKISQEASWISCWEVGIDYEDQVVDLIRKIYNVVVKVKTGEEA